VCFLIHNLKLNVYNVFWGEVVKKKNKKRGVGYGLGGTVPCSVPALIEAPFVATQARDDTECEPSKSTAFLSCVEGHCPHGTLSYLT
jgi:hypothetical protein